jgi:pyrroline-5-carboxylate reductase
VKLEGTLGFLGFGNMGRAIAEGLVKTGTIEANRVAIFDVAEAKQEEAAALGITVADSPAGLAGQCDTLVLAVKPQQMAEALEALKPGLSPDTLVISIAAGISIAFVQNTLGAALRVIRVMPNTPALVNAGAAGAALSETCTETDAATARTIFEAIGIVEIVPEDAIDGVTALSGSGPAYFFHVVECLVEAATAQGLTEEQATRLAGQTLLGAGRLLAESGESASVLRERVTSKGGTTEAALKTFREKGLAQVIAAGVTAAADRSRELGK